MKIVLRDFYGPFDWGWVQQNVPMKRVEDTCGVMAIDEEKNETVGGIIFDNFLNNSVQATIILKSSMVLRSNLLETAFNYIFNTHDKKYMYVLIAKNNIPSLRLAHKLGFREKMDIKDGYADGIDFAVLELNRDDCEYYKKLKEVA